MSSRFLKVCATRSIGLFLLQGSELVVLDRHCLSAMFDDVRRLEAVVVNIKYLEIQVEPSSARAKGFSTSVKYLLSGLFL